MGRPMSVLTCTLGLWALVPAGCSMSAARSTSSSRGDSEKAPPRVVVPDETRDLRLFGQGDITHDVSFESKAATNIQQHTTASEGADFDPSLDPSGQTLVFASTRHSRHSHLYLKPVGGTALTQLTDERANDAQPAFSPDGLRIAFASDRSGHWDIWVIDANGRNARAVTNNPMPELHPSWSPDGRRMAYCRLQPRGGGGELWIADLDQPGVKRLIGEGLFPAWSPKGDLIAYQRARERGSRWFSLWTLKYEDNEALYPTEVASSVAAALIAPAWSGDGSQIAFSMVTPSAGAEKGTSPAISGQGRADIGVVDADGRGLQQLTNGRGENFSPAWSMDGRIYFTAKTGRKETIWSLRPFRPLPPRVMPAPKSADNRRAAEASGLEEAD